MRSGEFENSPFLFEGNAVERERTALFFVEKYCLIDLYRVVESFSPVGGQGVWNGDRFYAANEKRIYHPLPGHLSHAHGVALGDLPSVRLPS